MLTPPEAFDERKLPRTTGTLLEHVAEKLDYVVGDEFELCQRSFHFNLYAVYGGGVEFDVSSGLSYTSASFSPRNASRRSVEPVWF